MPTAQIRALVAATAMSAVLVHALAGHGPPYTSDDGMAGAAVGVCILLATAVAFAAAPKAEARPRVVVTDEAAVYVAAMLSPSPDSRARASPSSLQRFRN